VGTLFEAEKVKTSFTSGCVYRRFVETDNDPSLHSAFLSVFSAILCVPKKLREDARKKRGEPQRKIYARGTYQITTKQNPVRDFMQAETTN